MTSLPSTPAPLRAWVDAQLPRLTEWDAPLEIYVLTAEPDAPVATGHLLHSPGEANNILNLLLPLLAVFTSPSRPHDRMRDHLLVPGNVVALAVVCELWYQPDDAPDDAEPLEARAFHLVEPNGNHHEFLQVRSQASGPEPLHETYSPALNPAEESSGSKFLEPMRALCSAMALHSTAGALAS